MAQQDRSNSYLMKRLESEHPTIYADWKAGKFSSPRQALIAAGLRQPPKPLNNLKTAWKKANASERAEFLKWIGAPQAAPNAGASSTTSSTKPTRLSPRASAIVGSDGKLLPAVKARIKLIMQRRGLRQGAVLKEMGYTDVHDASLGMALSEGNPRTVRPDLELKLAKWLKDNKTVK
jgi:hypothetical protein